LRASNAPPGARLNCFLLCFFLEELSMYPFPARRPVTTRKTFTPRLESLEDRTVPAVTVVQTGNVIEVTGDNRNDSVFITDNGRSDAGAILITSFNLKGGTGGVFRSQPLDPGLEVGIIIKTKGGEDLVDYKITGSFNRGWPTTPLATRGRVISAELGSGNDRFGFRGDDPTDFYNRSPGFDVINSTLDVSAFGQSGDDKIAINYQGSVEKGGHVDLEAGGGADNDFVFITENFYGGEGATNYALVTGNAGENCLGLILYKNRSFYTPGVGMTPFTASKGFLFGKRRDHAVATGSPDVFVAPAVVPNTVFV
jgi:hypothetical protein